MALYVEIILPYLLEQKRHFWDNLLYLRNCSQDTLLSVIYAEAYISV